MSATETPTPPAHVRPLYRLSELPELTGCSRQWWAKQIAAGRLRAARDGRTVFVSYQWLMDFLDGLPPARGTGSAAPRVAGKGGRR